MILRENDGDDGNDDILLSLCMAVAPSALRWEGPPAEEVLPQVVMNGRVEGPRYQAKPKGLEKNLQPLFLVDGVSP